VPDDPIPVPEPPKRKEIYVPNYTDSINKTFARNKFMPEDEEPLDVQFEKELKELRNHPKEQDENAALIPEELKCQIRKDLKEMNFVLPSDDEDDKSSEHSYSGKEGWYS
jgi:hypothetical protein